jgi:chromate transport protein ChrA
MNVLIIILGLVFASLFILIPILEKYGREKTPEELYKITRFMTPLMVIMLIVMAFRFMSSQPP